MISGSTSLSALIRQVAASPRSLQETSASVQSFPAVASEYAQSSKLSQQSGFAGVQRKVEDDGYVGSGLQLSLTLWSGRDIDLSIEKGVTGKVKTIQLDTGGELSSDDEAKLKQFLYDLSDSVDAIFSGTANGNLFDFTNQSGISDVEIHAQQDEGNQKQKLTFESAMNRYGRKDVSGEWLRYDRLTGENEQHHFALSKQPREVMMAYGKMDYQWVVDQVAAGMGVLGNVYTGDQSIQAKVTDVFVSAVHALFNETKRGHELLQSLGTSAQDAKVFLGRTIRALSSEHSTGQSESTHNIISANAASMNGLADFKADFSSKRESAFGVSSSGDYQLAMSVSQISHSVQGQSEDDASQIQTRRLILDYESQGRKHSFDYQWRHDEMLIHSYNQGQLEKTYFKLIDAQLSTLTQGNQQRQENHEYRQRQEYKADQPSPNLQNGYVKPKTYSEQKNSVHYTV